MSDLIASPSNPRIKRIVRLRTRRERDRSGLFIVEGYRETLRAVDGGISIEELYVCPDLYLGTNEAALVERAAAAGAEIITVGEVPFRKASYRDRPEGILGVARQFPVTLDRIDLTGDPIVLVAESIEKPGNLGTMLRTAEAAGAAGVVVCEPATDPFNPNVVRASLGTLFRVPLAVTSTEDAVSGLRGAGVRLLASTPAATSTIWEADFSGPVALVVGCEQYGLSDAWLEGADERVLIPMPGSVDSLNAAMSAGILLFEAVRRRTGT